MPYVQFNDQRFPLTAAELAVGAFEGAAVRLPGDDASLHAVLTVGPDGTGVVRRGRDDATILVNGVLVGTEPSPLLHGDRLSIGVFELRYGDDVRPASALPVASAPDPFAAPSGTRTPTSDTGGRLVSLVDGREYPVPNGGVTFGREIGNDIVIAATEVSRRHARIAPGEGGYFVTDTSTNGLTVNGVRVEKLRRLKRGDVLKIGPEEYRFYADASKASVPPSAGDAAAGAPLLAQAAAPAPAARTGGSLVGFPSFDATVVDLGEALVAASSSGPPAGTASVAVGVRAVEPVRPDEDRHAVEPVRDPQHPPQKVEAAPLPAEKKKGCMAMVAMLLTVGLTGTSLLAFLLTIRG